jgi:hypothetical protein
VDDKKTEAALFGPLSDIVAKKKKSTKTEAAAHLSFTAAALPN